MRKNTAFHQDEGKPRVDLIPPAAILAIGDVFTYGEKKYGDRNWEEYADSWAWMQLFASALRHMLKWAAGEEEDPETGRHHLAHAATNLVMLIELVRVGRGKDDRSTLSVAPYQGYDTVPVIPQPKCKTCHDTRWVPGYVLGHAHDVPLACPDCNPSPPMRVPLE